MICKKCVHNEVCKYGENRSNGLYCTGEKCRHFKEEKGDDTMPSIEHMRSAISDAYEGEGWKFRCEHMHQNQVIAIYRSLMKRGAFEPGGLDRSKKDTKQNSPETATDAPRFIPYTGVQLSMFDL